MQKKKDAMQQIKEKGLERYLLEQEFITVVMSRPVNSYVVPTAMTDDLIVQVAVFEHPMDVFLVYGLRIAQRNERAHWTYHFYYTEQGAQRHLYSLTGIMHTIS